MKVCVRPWLDSNRTSMLHFQYCYTKLLLMGKRAEAETPLLKSGDRKKIIPLLTVRKCLLVVLSGMRFDQYLYIERALKNLFNVNRQYFLATLPSAEEFSQKLFLCR